MSVKALQDYTFASKYARYLPEQKRRETWAEAVDRVRDMHIKRYPQIERDITWAFEQVKQRKVLGSQRALQFGGDPILKKNARIYNCLGRETEFITSEGVKSFCDFQDGDKVTVMSHLGNWKKAIVRCYGEDCLYKISVVRGGDPYDIYATKNHRWILKNQEITDNLQEEDQLTFGPTVFSDFVYENANPMERLYWCYGYTYGDGTLYKDQNGEHRWSGVRLCGAEEKYEDRFLEHGFISSSSASLEGDVIAYTGKYLKTLPDPSVDSPEMIRAFVSGYLTADGTKSRSYKVGASHGKLSPYDSIQATGQKSVDFIRKCFPIAGVYIVSETDLTGQETNFGFRSDITIKFNIVTAFGKTAKSFRVESIEHSRVDSVWCLEVEDDQSFMLPFGLPTGNCIASYCDRSRFFQECFWLLLCGCGTGFSVQKHHIAKLPKFDSIWAKETSQTTKKVYIIPDSIEGWSDSLGVLLSAYFEDGEFPEYQGTEVVFDYSLIRPEGAPLGSSSGKAPGPKPLMRALEKIRDVLNKCVMNGQKALRPIDAYDIVMHASDAVLSGGVRRSATICLFSPDDEEMATAKIGNWFIENPQRGRSNNSALLLRGKTSKEDFQKLMGYVREFGEPGFVWSDSTELVVNPCVTADTVVSTHDGLQLVENLISKQFIALVDGKPHKSSINGFWKTDVKDVIELEFDSGRTLKLTTNHKLLTTDGWKESGDITFEDDVVIHNHRSGEWRASTERKVKWLEADRESFARGYCLGHLLSDGNLVDNTSEMKWWGENREEYRSDALSLLENAGWRSPHHKDAQENSSVYSCLQSTQLSKFAESKNCLKDGKHLDVKALAGDWRYLAGLVAGYFDADGTVCVNHQKGCSLRITSINKNNLKNLQIILNSFGVFSKIYNDRYPEGDRLMPDGQGGMKLYHCQATHELCISCDNIQEFQKMIPIRNKDKIQKIQQIVDGYARTPNRSKFTDKIINKKLIGRLPVYDCTIDEVHAFDANGVYAHNCVEIGLYPVDIETGATGWEACNLCEINGRYCKSEEDYAVASKAAAIIGTCQAGYVDLDYLGPTTRKILCREALLGVSITGMMDNPGVLFDSHLQQKMAKLILDVNEEIALKIGINPTARATCVKPAGCLEFNTKIKTSEGSFTLLEIFEDQGYSFDEIKNMNKEWLELKKPLLILNENNEIENVTRLYVNGEIQTYEIPLDDGSVVKCTPWHKFKLTDETWKRADELSEGDDILSY